MQEGGSWGCCLACGGTTRDTKGLDARLLLCVYCAGMNFVHSKSLNLTCVSFACIFRLRRASRR